MYTTLSNNQSKTIHIEIIQKSTPSKTYTVFSATEVTIIALQGNNSFDLFSSVLEHFLGLMNESFFCSFSSYLMIQSELSPKMS